MINRQKDEPLKAVIRNRIDHLKNKRREIEKREKGTISLHYLDGKIDGLSELFVYLFDEFL